ncbi:MCE family protein [Mycobacterium colombiense]
MTRNAPLRRLFGALLVVATAVSGCGWRGLNSIPMPGVKGQGAGSYQVKAQLPNVSNIQQNSRVKVGDVDVGTVTKIEREGWHALITMRLDGNVKLPANATAKVGQTSLLGSLHVELAPPAAVPPAGTLRDGSLIPLSHGGIYPTTEQTLGVLSLLLNGGGLGQIQDITKAFSIAFAGREQDVRNLIQRLDEFFGRLNEQTGDITAATESLNSLAGQFAAQKPVVDNALRTITDALAVLSDERKTLVDALDRVGRFSAVTADAVGQTKGAFVQEVKDLAPVLDSLANAGPAMTRSLSMLSTYPYPKETIANWQRGDYGNLTGVFDLTLSRLDSSLLTGTRWEGSLTRLELQWGRTIGQLPSPATAANPLVVPYHVDQGP